MFVWLLELEAPLNKYWFDPNPLRFTHPLQVHVFLFPALAGVLLKYAESAELNRKLRSMR
jgi:hypothetical protein